MATSRKALHAGSWYSKQGNQLSSQLDGWLKDASGSSHAPARAIIAPHAGYSYSGPCAAHAYRQIDPSVVSRVFILGPSHHLYLPDCALSSLTHYETPLYDLIIDTEVYKELEESGKFSKMTKKVDEEEHSIEMHLPYIARVMNGNQFTIVPILVGALKQDKEAMYGKLLSKYLLDERNLFVISSDFCHWGERFRFMHHDKQYGAIHKSIEALDRQGMTLIESVDAFGFKEYLQKYGNTICGRHPISVLLHALHYLQSVTDGLLVDVKFLKYAQSNQCKTVADSSVSYASASVLLNK